MSKKPSAKKLAAVLREELVQKLTANQRLITDVSPRAIAELIEDRATALRTASANCQMGQLKAYSRNLGKLKRRSDIIRNTVRAFL